MERHAVVKKEEAEREAADDIKVQKERDQGCSGGGHWYAIEEQLDY